MNNVRSSMFNRSKPKIWCSSAITNRWTHLSSFDVPKKDVWVSSMSNLVNLVNLVEALIHLMFVHSKSKLGFSSSTTNRWTHLSSFDVQKDEIRVSSTSDLENLVIAPLGSKFKVRSFEAKKGCLCLITNRWTYLSSFNVQKMMYKFVLCSIKWCLTHHYYIWNAVCLQILLIIFHCFRHIFECSLSW